MSGICGWIDSRLESPRLGILTEMLDHLNGDDTSACTRILENAAAVATRPGIVPITTHCAGALAVAVQGYVHWASLELETFAADQGCAATLAEAYRRRGGDCLRDIWGPFAIALVDLESGSGLLAIDRMGIRTLCYANPPGQLVFGSTVDSVAVHPSVGRHLSHQAIFNYLYCHVVPSPGAIYQGVHKLRPGECLTFRKGAVDRRFYWRLPYHDEAKQPFSKLADRFKGLLTEAVKRTVDGDTAIGAFLSGGTDSSTIAGLLTELGSQPARTYSIGFAATGFDEMEYARIAARHFATDAHEYYVTPEDVLDAIPMIARAYDEPFGNSSAVPTYFCAKTARADGVRVMLAGDGGDEIFGGNARYAKQKMFEAYAALPAVLRKMLIEPLALALPAGEHIAPLRKLKSYIQQASIPLPDRLETYNFLHGRPLSQIFDTEFLAAVDEAEPLAMLREAYQRTDSASAINRMMHLDLKITLADNDLRKVSRMCDLAGIEVRFPLLNEALVEFSGEIPPLLKVRRLKLRYFFKEALKDFLPRATIVKAKHGFGLPFGLWLKDYIPLAEFATESLNAFRRRDIVKQSYIDELLHSHKESHATYFGSMIWVIAMLEQWMAVRKL